MIKILQLQIQCW